MQLLDAARVVAAVGVVGAHVVDEFFPGDAISVLGTFAVPFYLFVALYFTVHGLASKPDRSIAAYLGGRVVKLYVPFLLWNVIYDVLHIAKHPTDGLTPLWMILWAAFYTHLYFLPLLLVVTAIAAIATRPVLRSRVRTWSAAFVLLCVGLVIALEPQPMHLRDPARIELETLWNMYRSLPAACAALAFAFLIAGRSSPKRLTVSPWIGLAGVILTVSCLATEWRLQEHPILRTLSGFGLVLLAFVPLHAAWLKPMARLGRLSFGVYLAHVAIIRICVAALDQASIPHSIVTATLVVVTSLAGGFAISALLARSQWTRWMIGFETGESKRPPQAATASALPSLPQTVEQRIAAALASGPR